MASDSYILVHLLLKHGTLEIRIVETSTRDKPTPFNSTDITNDRSGGRGSIVFLNQASMFQSSETNENNLTEAHLKKKSGTRDFGADVQEGFLQYAKFAKMG